MLADLAYALRQLARAPGFTVLVVLCLALGIGANVATFGAVDALLFRPPVGVRDPSTVRRLRIEMAPTPGQQIFFNLGFSVPDVEALRARRETFASIAAFAEGHGFVERGDFAQPADLAAVGPEYFATLGVRPTLGRLIGGPEASATSAAPLAVLGHAFWMRAFGGDRTVVGTTLRVNGRALTIVGVAAPGFGGSELQPASVFVPLGMGDLVGYAPQQLAVPENKWLTAVARLAPGIDPRRASAVATTVLKGVDAAQGRPVLGFDRDAGRQVRTPALHEHFATNMGTPPVPAWLLGATGAVLLVVCANVANLLLLRAERRRREIATRLALGAARGRVARQLFAEGVVLAIVGGALGLGVAAAGTRLFRLIPSMPPVDGLIGGRAVLFGCGVTLLTTLGFALAPSLLATRGGAGELLRSGARATTRRAPLRAALLVVQFAVSLALLGAGGLFVRSLRNVDAVDVGFDARRTLAVRVDWRAFGITPAESRLVLARARDRVRGLAGVRDATLAALAPFTGAMMASLHVPGRASLDDVSGVPGGMFFTNAVDGAYFRTMGLSVVRGRAPAATVGEAEREIAVSETFLRRVFPGEDPVGRCVASDAASKDCLRIVGVVRDARFMSVTVDPPPIFYSAIPRDGDGASTLIVGLRDGADAAQVRAGVEAVRAAVQAAEPRIRFVTVAPIADGMLRSALAPYRLAATAFTAFGALALLLAAVGLYGVVAYAVTQRSHEFGIRMALGARSLDVRRLVLRQGVRTALVGGALGAASAVGIGRALRSRLYGVDPLDPLSLLVVAVVLAAVTLVAAWLPARRAARVDPVVALRAD